MMTIPELSMEVLAHIKSECTDPTDVSELARGLDRWMDDYEANLSALLRNRLRGECRYLIASLECDLARRDAAKQKAAANV